MSLPYDIYVQGQAQSDTLCSWYLALETKDTLVYLTTEGFLRFKEVGSPQALTLSEGVSWCSAINHDPDLKGRRLYFYVNGSFWLLRCKKIAELGLARTQLSTKSFPSTIRSFSVGHRTRDDLWVMLVDDGSDHWLYTASNDTFTRDLEFRSVFTLGADPTVARPSLGIHQDVDNDLITVAVEYTTKAGDKGVGTYTVNLFKLDGSN